MSSLFGFIVYMDKNYGRYNYGFEHISCMVLRWKVFTQNMFLQKTGIGKKEDLSRPAITRPFSVFIHFRFLSKVWP